MKKLIFFLSSLTLVVLLSHCNKQKKVLATTPTLDKEMISLNTNDYEQVWKTIDSLDQKGLPKSALEKVQELYTTVQEQNEPAQIIKCLIYLGKYQSQLEEDGFVKTIQDMSVHIEKASFPQNKILESMIGEMYMRYLDQQYWKFRDRTELGDFKPDDIQTWTVGQLTEEARKYYLASISDDRTKQVKLADFSAILSQEVQATTLQPTLYDFLVYRAINHFSNSSNYLTEPAYKFHIDQLEAFADAMTFTNFEFTSRDSTSRKLATVQLFQKLLAARQQDESAFTYVHADVRRLKFMYNHSVVQEKGERYLKALQRLEEKYKDVEISAEVSAEIASYYYQEGASYQVGDQGKKKEYRKKAYEICQRVINKFPDSFGAKQCRAIQASILQKELRFETELVNIPNEPVLMRISYQNISKLYGRVIKVTPKQKKKIEETDWDKKGKEIMRFDPIKGFSIDLPKVEDYYQHATEYKLDPIGPGTYLVVFSTGKDLTDQKNALQYTFLHSSDILYSSRNTEGGKTEFVVTSRTNGEPLAGVTVEFYEEKYNSFLRRYENRKIGSVETNSDGKAISDNLPDRARFKVKFSKGEDQLDLQTGGSNNSRSYQRRKNSTIHFFLDRAIYRPGQMVYFKGLALESDTEGKPSILPNEAITVELRDVNNQVTETLNLRSNEYGTINGVFTAPNNGLTGSMRIVSSFGTSRSTKRFRVEEYKRPKFEVKIDPVKGSIKLGEQVTVQGNAKAYAGNNIDGAKVVYRVIRQARFPYYPWWRRGWWRPSVPEVEITNGETKTDEKGIFKVDFEALGDPSIDPATKPEFYYTVYADVIDITGETHSASRGVSVGNIALRVSFDVPELVNTDSLKTATISTTNLNGEFEAATGTLKIERLKTPEVTYKNRLWKAPDQRMVAKDDFVKAFPNVAYDGEDLPQNWPVLNKVFEQNFDTENAKELSLANLNLAAGKYAFTLNTKDAFGEAIELKRFITVYDLNSGKVPSNEDYFHVMEQATWEPGQIAEWYFGTFGAEQKILLEIEHQNKLIRSEWLTVNGLSKATQAIVETHRGNLFYNIYFTKNNRIYNHAHTINVPWTNKKLSIEYGTFRDKLYPGQDETWQIKISGPEKEKVMAEMVAGMYDASLDVFAANAWSLNPFPYSYKRMGWRGYGIGATNGREAHYNWNSVNVSSDSRYLEYLNWFGFNYYEFRNYNRGGAVMMDAVTMEAESMPRSAPAPAADMGNSGTKRKKMSKMKAETAGLSSMDEDDLEESIKTGVDEGEATTDTPPQIRTNLKETVFFFPDLKTDKEGNVIIQFKMNEALTRWKFMGMAHTKDLKLGFTSKEIVTQKDLMVLPNPPRFFREGDAIEFTAKVSNLTEKEISGTASLQLFDAITMESIDAELGNTSNTVNFTAKAGQSDRLAWKLKIPIGQLGAVTHRVVAKSNTFSDGEESVLPIVSNRMLVTETQPLPVRGNQTKDFTFRAMEKASRSNTLTHHKMTLEFTSNPAWYAVKSLPYLMEYPYECTEQIFSRYYSNALASSVANAHPKVKRVFDQWKGTEAMESNLTKNQELKSALLEETPWVLQAQSEEQQRRNIGLLFDLNRMSREAEKAMSTIADRQMGNGGFSWFPGGRDSWYITQYLVEGMGHLNELGVAAIKEDSRTERVIDQALGYLDRKIEDQYNELKKSIKRYGGDINKDHLNNLSIHYLYARSFFKDTPILESAQEAVDYYMGQAKKYWLDKGMYSEGMIALALKRFEGTNTTSQDIVKSLKERSLNNEELGMYWKYNTGFYWYQLPIETHALMIEVFDEVAEDAQAVDDLKVWLLKNKQTTHWKTTKATAAAVYALLRRGDNWLLEDQPVKITLGDQVLDQSKLQTEAGTGYFKTSWNGKEVRDNMSQVKVENPNKVVAWGAMYWQYFEQLDKIETFEDTPLKINKKLFKVRNSDTGPQMDLLTDGATLAPGDKLQVRIELRVDRDMEYVHLKDMRASGFEPINVLSSYKWQGGLGYYESTRDVATNFFISYLPKGTYVFEYPLRVIHNGDFSNGITTIQSMYAPEFTSHSEGIRVKVGE